MINTVLGTKIDLTQTWTKSGLRLPVTRIQSGPLAVTQIKTLDQDGYTSLQVGLGNRPWTRITRPLQGHLKKSQGAKPEMAPQFLKEITTDSDTDVKLGDSIDLATILKVGDIVNVTGISKGKGFSGVVKRWGFKGGPRTHGQSDRERAPGSIGQGTTPGRIHKGKKMAGHQGSVQVTVRNLVVVKVDSENNQIWLKGQVPGSRHSLVIIKKVGHHAKFVPLFSIPVPAGTPDTSDTTPESTSPLANQDTNLDSPK